MHTVYLDGSLIQECNARLSGGPTIAVDKAEDLEALQALCLECRDAASFGTWIPNYDMWLEWFEAHKTEYESRFKRLEEQSAIHPRNLTDIDHFRSALHIAAEVWRATPLYDADKLVVLVSVT